MKKDYSKVDIAVAKLSLTTPSIKFALGEDIEFKKEFKFFTYGIYHIGNPVVEIYQSTLLSAIRKIYDNGDEISIKDTDNQELMIMRDKSVSVENLFYISTDDQKIILDNYSTLSESIEIRLKFIKDKTIELNLLTHEFNYWKAILTKRPLTDEEFSELSIILRDTPISSANILANEFKKGKTDVSLLVPLTKKYYERLIGNVDDSDNINEYASNVLQDHLKQLSSWDPYHGFLHSLLLSSHIEITSKISTDNLSEEELIRAFEYIVGNGDIISQVGAIEVGLRILSEKPKILPLIKELIKIIKDTDTTSIGSEFSLLSNLFHIVDTELSKKRLFTNHPPFYRRFASLTQAALISREIIYSRIEIKSFCKWASKLDTLEFNLQSLVDMRHTPKWSPAYADPEQLKAEFIGRILITAEKYIENITDPELRELVIDWGENHIHKVCNFSDPFLAGPLDDNAVRLNKVPKQIVEEISRQLNSDKLSPKSFIALANTSMIYGEQNNQVELATQALKTINNKLDSIQNKEVLLAMIAGLSTVAAISRSTSLAKQVRLLVRRYRHHSKCGFSIEHAITICLISAASCSDIKEWRDFIGDWITEFAFGELESNEANVLYTELYYLLHISPELWVSCGKAEAALSAFIAIK